MALDHLIAIGVARGTEDGIGVVDVGVRVDGIDGVMWGECEEKEKELEEEEEGVCMEEYALCEVEKEACACDGERVAK